MIEGFYGFILICLLLLAGYIMLKVLYIVLEYISGTFFNGTDLRIVAWIIVIGVFVVLIF